MDINLESLLKRAKIESKLDQTGDARKKYMRLITALNTYDVINNNDLLGEYYIDKNYIRKMRDFKSDIKYRIEIVPTQLHPVDGVYILFNINNDADGSTTAYGYIKNTNDSLLRKLIEDNELTKNDFIIMVKLIDNYIQSNIQNSTEYNIIIHGYSFKKYFNGLSSLEKCDPEIFEQYKSYQCIDDI